MATYNSYDDVKKLQEFLGDQLAAGVIAGPTLKTDGQYGPLTDGAFQAWVAAAGNEWQAKLAAEGLAVNGELLPEIATAMAEYRAGGVAHAGGGGTAAAPAAVAATEMTAPAVITPQKEGLGVWAWIGIGAGVAAAAALGWWLYKRSREQQGMEPEMAGLDDLGDAGELGCGCGK